MPIPDYLWECPPLVCAVSLQKLALCLLHACLGQQSIRNENYFSRSALGITGEILAFAALACFLLRHGGRGFAL
jgi:hypothetical protein